MKTGTFQVSLGDDKMKNNKKNRKFFSPSIFPKSRKGDIPITILVIGVFLVCSLALLSFYLSGINEKKTATRLEIMREVNSLTDEIKFYKNPEINKNPDILMDAFNKKNSNDNPSYDITNLGGKYKIDAAYFENKYQVLGFGFGEKKTIFSVEYTFKP